MASNTKMEDLLARIATAMDLLAVAAPRSSVALQSNVASSATSVIVLAANQYRVGAAVFNDSNQLLYLLLGAAVNASAVASSTVHTVQVGASDYYEVPFGFTGVISGAWAAANGSARVTEFTR